MMRPRVLLSTDRLFVTASTPTEWRLRGAPGAWWFGFDWDSGHVAFPARESRDASLYVRVCGLEITVWP